MNKITPLMPMREKRFSCDSCGHSWTIHPDDIDGYANCPVCNGITDWIEGEVHWERMSNVEQFVIDNAKHLPFLIREDFIEPIIRGLNSRTGYESFVQEFNKANPDMLWDWDFDYVRKVNG